MKYNIKTFIWKREFFCHVPLNRINMIAFPLSYQQFRFYLLRGIIKHGTLRAQRMKNRHLLTAA